MRTEHPGKTRSIAVSSRRGSSLVEMLVVVFILSLVITCMAAGLRAMSVGASQQVTDTALGIDARRGVDEMLSQMRYAREITGSYTTGGKNYTTSSSTIVMAAYGYDPAVANIILPTVTDYMIFQYDATTRQIKETLIPGTGSKRIARSNYVIAKNVDSVAFTYRARDQFTQPLVASSQTLHAKATSMPLFRVNGQESSGAWLIGIPQQVTVSAASGSDVQVLYLVNLSDSSTLKYIQQVDVAVNFSASDSRNITRTLAMSGSACLRNSRDIK